MDEEIVLQEGEQPAAEKPGKKVRTPEEKRHRRRRGWLITAIVFGAIGLLIAILAIVNAVGVAGLMRQAKAVAKVVYTNPQSVPEIDSDGYYTFTVKNDMDDFQILQLTDIHIGAGFLSAQKDTWAMNAVATMVRSAQPDLVVVTGDIAFPVPYAAGTFNNLAAIKVFANMMEKLGVYWTFAFGNHDTEAYSQYSRKQICDWLADQHFVYCLFEANNDIADKKEAESFGYGNNIIKIKNNEGAVIQALVTFDSHSYTDNDYFGALWRYDNIHQNQIDWYVAEMAKLRAANAAHGFDTTIKNVAFFHIPLREYREAWGQYTDNNFADTADVHKIYGVNGEQGGALNPLAGNEDSYGVYCGVYKEELDGKFWQAALANDMQGTFCGHDHLNNFSLYYTKDGQTLRLTYGMSIDYLAYSGIFKQHAQRGCTAIQIHTDGSFDCQAYNYYSRFGVDPEAGDAEDVPYESVPQAGAKPVYNSFAEANAAKAAEQAAKEAAVQQAIAAEAEQNALWTAQQNQ